MCRRSAAHIGVVDRLFSRVGAADDLARGRSTFMVEMIETAAILNQAGPHALVILDEIGRGTATFDGLSIAWAAVEHLHEVNRSRALFATHYHELTALAHRLPRLDNVTVRVKEWKGEVIFLHEIAPGAADRSYGIQVARLAGLPAAVVARAREVLKQLEATDRTAPAHALIDDLPLFSAARPAANRPRKTRLRPSSMRSRPTNSPRARRSTRSTSSRQHAAARTDLTAARAKPIRGAIFPGANEEWRRRRVNFSGARPAPPTRSKAAGTRTAAAFPSGTSIPMTGTSPCRTTGKVETGNVAINAYDRDQSLKDIALLKELGVNAYRFSVSWPRVLPAGIGAVNRPGLDYYSRLVDDLLAAGIKPVVTLYHWDFPWVLHEKGGFHNRDVVGWFTEYAGTMFKALGDRVDTFITMNEPFIDLMMMDLIAENVRDGRLPPERMTAEQYGRQIPALHNLFVAAAAATAEYRRQNLGGMVGLAAPLSPASAFDPDNPADVAAAADWERFLNRWPLDAAHQGHLRARRDGDAQQARSRLHRLRCGPRHA